VQVWREPATRFVAGFLGEMNLLPARPAGAGRAQVTALAATLDVAGPRPDGEPLPDGAPAWVTGDELGVEVAEVACRLLTS
jgi:hypothetical protein